MRLNVQARSESIFQFIEFNLLDSPREACAVCSLDLTADAGRWKDAISIAVREMRRLGEFGLTSSELTRYSLAMEVGWGGWSLPVQP